MLEMHYRLIDGTTSKTVIDIKNIDGTALQKKSTKKMDDAFEDELIYDAILKHISLITKLMVSLTGISLRTTSSTVAAAVAASSRIRPEICIACALLVGLAGVFILSALNQYHNNNNNSSSSSSNSSILNGSIAKDHESSGLWSRYWPIRIDVLISAIAKTAQTTTGSRSSRLVRVLNSDAGSGGIGGGGGNDHATAAGDGTWQLIRPNVGCHALQGRRNKMEDRFSVLQYSNVALYGVFDGHGGDMAADFVEKTLFKGLMLRFESHFNATDPATPLLSLKSDLDIAQLLSEEILAVDTRLLELSKASKDYAGTTALVAVVYNGKLVVANVGDSRGVVCDKKEQAIPLSFDHKPQQLKEQKRIKQAGGLVTFNGVWRVAGILATSRALGDYPLKDRNLIIADPDVLTFDLDDLKPKFMILASDGLWDTFTNEEAVSFIKKSLHESDHGAKSLAQQAYQRGSLDNITVIVVTFPPKAAA